MLELPAYHWPNLRNLGIGLWQRVEIFMSRVGTIILALMVILWALSSFPHRRRARRGRPSSTALPTFGRMARRDIQAIGFNWQISIALVRDLRRGKLRWAHWERLCAVRDRQRREQRLDAADHTVVELADGALAACLVRIRSAVPVDVGDGQARDQFLALPIIMAAYLFAMAYAGSWITFRVATALAGS